MSARTLPAVLKAPVGGYAAYIVDVDGTLYSQPRLRGHMAAAILGFVLRHPLRLKEILAVLAYRRVHNAGTFAAEADFAEKEFAWAGQKFGLTPEEVRQLFRHWMLETPLEAVRQTRDAALLTFLAAQKQRGAQVIAYSDYPVADKLRCLQLDCDAGYSAGDEHIACLKPDPQGLRYILDHHALDPASCLYIGDRCEKDGLCAAACGVDYLILPAGEKKRRALYRKLGLGPD